MLRRAEWAGKLGNGAGLARQRACWAAASALVVVVGLSGFPDVAGANQCGIPGQNVLNSVAATSPSNAWAVGRAAASNTQCGGHGDASYNETLIEHWNGSAWKIRPNPLKGQLSAVVSTSPSNVWAVGNVNLGGQRGGAPLYKLLIEHWNGPSLSVSNPSPPAACSDPTYIDEATAWGANVWYSASGYNNNSDQKQCSFIAHWNGNAWSYKIMAIPNDPTPIGVGGLAAWSASDVWTADGSENGYNPEVGTLSGSSWTGQTVPSPRGESCQLSHVAATSGTQAWAAGSCSNPQSSSPVNYPLIETLSGSTWTPHSVNVPGGLPHAIAGTTASDAWAVGGVVPRTGAARTLIIRGNGSSWTVYPGPSTGTSSASLADVAVTSPSNAWAVGIWHNGKTLIEHWNGSSWTVQQSPNEAP